MTSPIDTKFFRTLWGLRIMPKWKLFVWKLWHNGLATTANLHRRGIAQSGECPICLHDQEDNDHLFRQSPLAIEAWEQGSLIMQLPNPRHLPFTKWVAYWILKLNTEDGSQESTLSMFVGTLWAIWKLRNAQIFRQQRPTTALINLQLQDNMRHHAIFVQQVHDPTRNPLDPSTSPGFVIANIGHQNGRSPSIIIQIAGTRPNKTGLGGMAWVMGFTNSPLVPSMVRLATPRPLNPRKL